MDKVVRNKQTSYKSYDIIDDKSASNMYYDPRHPVSYSTLNKLAAAVKHGKKTRADLKQFLEAQDAYTLHKHVRKRFQRNAYSVTNLLDVCECDLVDVQSLGKYNDNYKYLLTVLDVFSNYLHMVPLKSKTVPTVTVAFQSILKGPRYSKPKRKRPIWVRTDKVKQFLNKTFQDMLKNEGIQFQVCRNHDVKCSIVERAHRTIRERMYKYFTAKNT
jgi:hypothetical protein